MRKKNDQRKLTLTSQTVRTLDQVELVAAVGGYGQTAYICTKKASGCAQCPE